MPCVQCAPCTAHPLPLLGAQYIPSSLRDSALTRSGEHIVQAQQGGMSGQHMRRFEKLQSTSKAKLKSEPLDKLKKSRSFIPAKVLRLLCAAAVLDQLRQTIHVRNARTPCYKDAAEARQRLWSQIETLVQKLADLPEMAGVAVTEFNASQNPLGQQGAVYLARLLNVKRIPTQFLQSVFLDSCHITDAGGAVLVRSMCDHACAFVAIVMYACASHMRSCSVL